MQTVLHVLTQKSEGENNQTMALLIKREDLIHVPWLSVEEWLETYKQIYSADLNQQQKAYEILLLWKARLPKLPVGIECTLGLLQACIRDRDWTPKINTGQMSMTYENDLRMMYSTVIMKFINHISNIAHNKQTSLYVVAKQLNIPDWIVDLRHDTAHGHELPSIDVMRIVANILLTWLHEEYWAAEAKALQETQAMKDDEFLNHKEEENLIDLIELWTALGLYIKTKHKTFADLPDDDVKKTLSVLFNELGIFSSNDSNNISEVLNEKTELSTISRLLFLEISKNLSKTNSVVQKEKAVIDTVLHNDAFLTKPEILSLFIEESSEKSINCLPQSLVEFWEDFLILLQEKNMLLILFLQLLELIKIETNQNRKLLASLWVKTIAQAFNKLKIAKCVYQTLEQELDQDNVTLNSKEFLKKVQEKMNKFYPELKNVPTLNINGDFPKCLRNHNFVKKLILTYYEFSEHYIPEIIKIASFLENDAATKEQLISLMKIHSVSNESEEHVIEIPNKIYSVDDIVQKEDSNKALTSKSEKKKEFFDNKLRNTSWKIAEENLDWKESPIGVLPWQLEEPLELPIVTISEVQFGIVNNIELPKIINRHLHSRIQWDDILKKTKRLKRVKAK